MPTRVDAVASSPPPPPNLSSSFAHSSDKQSPGPASPDATPCPPQILPTRSSDPPTPRPTATASRRRRISGNTLDALAPLQARLPPTSSSFLASENLLGEGASGERRGMRARGCDARHPSEGRKGGRGEDGPQHQEWQPPHLLRSTNGSGGAEFSGSPEPFPLPDLFVGKGPYCGCRERYPDSRWAAGTAAHQLSLFSHRHSPYPRLEGGFKGNS